MSFRRTSTPSVSGTPTVPLRLRWVLLGACSGFALAFGVSSLPSVTALPSTAELASSTGLSSITSLFSTASDSVDGAAGSASETASSAEDKQFPMLVELQVRQGDTLLSMLTDTDVPYEEAVDVVQAVKQVYNPRKLNVGQSLSLSLDKPGRGDAVDPNVTALAIEVSPIESIKLTRKADGSFKVEKVKEELEKNYARLDAKIQGSLYETGQKAGLNARLLGELINALSYDVDFQRDIKAGDRIEMVYEKLVTKDGVHGGNGGIVFASLDLGERKVEIYRHIDKDGNAAYYNGKGESIRKALLRTPINGARLTSGFGMRRHPVMGYTKMHKGVDFAAPIGTPIYAAGDGVVSFASRKGGYGNYLKIDHNKTYGTAYGHLSRFASGIRPGARVRQGQVVAYVGNTGVSTGPHLHYEVHVNGQQINPAGVKFKTGETLTGNELARFKANIQQVKQTVAMMEKQNISEVSVASLGNVVSTPASAPASAKTKQ